MTTPEPWDDDRLGAAFAANGRRRSTPPDLVSGTLAALRTPRAVVPLWRRLLAPAAVLVVAAVGVGGGLALIGSPGGSSGLVEFRRGPTAELQTLDAFEFAFDFPADWRAYDAGAPFSGGSSIAVLGTQPVEPRCGDGRHVDVNCVFEQPLEPGQIRVFVGTGAYRGGSVLDRPDIENGSTTRMTIGEMPAILDELDPQPDSYYQEDVSLQWSIGRPATLTNVIRIELRSREWPVRGRVNTPAEVRAATQVIIDSFRFAAPPPSPLPSDPMAATAAAIAAIDAQALSFRGSYVDPDDSTPVTYLECLGDEPDTMSTADVRYGPGGDLGGTVKLACSWTIRVETPTIWRLDLTYDWAVAGRSGRYVETLWIDAASKPLASDFSGEPPPAVAAAPATAPRLRDLPVRTVSDLIARADAGATPEEVIVRGWLSNAGVSIQCISLSNPHPLIPGCLESYSYLVEDAGGLDGNGGLKPPSVPFVVPMLREDLNRDAAAGPEVIAIGHQSDHRWTSCPPPEQTACRGRFVIDRLLAAGDLPDDALPEPWYLGTAPAPGAGERIARALTDALGELTVVSIGVARRDMLASIEPAAIDLEVVQDVWVVRALTASAGPAVARTFVLPDFPFTDEPAIQIFEVTSDGVERLPASSAGH